MTTLTAPVACTASTTCQTRERLGELIYRLGMNSMLKAIDMKPVPQMVDHPRENPYIYWYGEDFNQTEVAE